jgi:hypothetical protein
VFHLISPSLIEGVGVSQTVQGIQDTGVIATVKHYIANEQVSVFLISFRDDLGTLSPRYLFRLVVH